MCRQEIMALWVCMDGLLALTLEWYMCLSNTANFCDKQSFSCADTSASRPVGSKNICPERGQGNSQCHVSFRLTAGSWSAVSSLTFGSHTESLFFVMTGRAKNLLQL